MRAFLLTMLTAIAATFNLSAEETMKEDPTIVFETNQGVIEIQLMPKVAPKACENMITLVKDHYYDGITFHRVIKGFMIQGGDPQGTGIGGQSCWGRPFKDECSTAVRFTEPGLLAMANAGPCTNGSQFFITTSTPTYLDGKHTIFGKVTSGYDVVEKIQSVPTTMQDRPAEPQKIIKAYVKQEANASSDV